MILVGRLEIVRIEDNLYQVTLGEPEYKAGDSFLYFELEFEADEFTNVSFDSVGRSPDYPKWPPTLLNKNRYILQGFAAGYPDDAFQASNLKYVRFSLISAFRPEEPASGFDAYYIDETVSPAKEKCLGTNLTSVTWKPAPKILGPLLVLGIPLGIVALKKGIKHGK